MPETSPPRQPSDHVGSAAAPEARRGFDLFDALVLGALAAVSLAFVFFIVIKGGGVIAGVEGFVLADQAQYLSWVRESAEHGLIANRFDLAPDERVFLYPPMLLSGLLHIAGLSTPLAYLAWKPVAVLVLFIGVWRYARRLLPGRWERRAALVLALFFVSPAGVLAPLWGGAGAGAIDFIAGESWPAGHLWGYPMTALAIGLMAFVFLAVERALDAAQAPQGGRWVRPAALAAAGSLAIAWIHPWQGSMLLGILSLSALWHARAGQAGLTQLARVIGPSLIAVLGPTVYFLILARTDPSWAASRDVYRNGLDPVAPWQIALALGPLALLALLGYRVRAVSLQDRILRLWPAVGVALYLFPSTPFRFHAFNGVSVPLAVLAVAGLAPHLARLAQRSGGPERGRRLAVAVAVAGCAVLVVPGTLDRIRSARGAVYLNLQPYRIDPGERDALRALEDAPGPGGVLSNVDLGGLVPGLTGRETWVGTVSWSPDFGRRAGAVGSLLAGGLDAAGAQAVAGASGARFVLQDCRSRADLRGVLGPMLLSSRAYGCATVHELRRPSG